MNGKPRSPSQTLVFSECPYKWYMQHVLGWSADGEGTEPQRVGTAFAAAMEHYNREWQRLGHKPWGTDVLPACIERANHANPSETPAHTLMIKALTKHLNTESTPETWEPIAVEVPRPDYGNCRADVVYRTPQGILVRDYKYTGSCEKRYVTGRLESYGTHPQRYHYMWSEQASLFQIVMVSGAPCAIHEQTWQTDPQAVQEWLTSQRAKWELMDQMEAGAVHPYMSDIHATKYGRCNIYEWCQELGRDHALLTVLGFTQRQGETPDVTTH